MGKKIDFKLLMQLNKALLNLKDMTASDGTQLYVDGELEVGKDLIMYDENGDAVPVPDGEYTVNDTVIVAEGGMVKEIRLKEPEPEPEPQNLSKYQAVASAFSESYEEREKKIAAAIIALGFDPYGWLISAGDDFAVWHTWTEDGGEKYTRFDVSWVDGEAKVENPIEVRTDFVPADQQEPAPRVEPSAEFEAMKVENEALKAELAEAKAKLELSIDPKPAGGGATEEKHRNIFLENIRQINK